MLWHIKNWTYKHSRLLIVTPSQWMANLAQASPLLQRFPIHVIPYGLDISIFRPIPKAEAREKLGIDPALKLILFSSHVTDSPRKGSTFLRKALDELSYSGPSNIALLVVGLNADQWDLPLEYPTKCVGLVDTEEMMAVIYSAADLFVLPTLADNLPLSIMESMACGTPVISFDVGGVPEMVRHMETGYLARYKDSHDLAAGIRLLLNDDDLRGQMGQRCRAIAESEYPLVLQARRYLDLYNDAIEKHRSKIPEFGKKEQ